MAVNEEANNMGRRSPTPSHYQCIAHEGACRKPHVVSYNRGPRPES
jgi:hypothetical protein